MPQSAPLLLANTPDLVDRAFQNIFKKTSEPEVKYKQYFNFRTTTDLYEKDSGLSGLAEADFVGENGVVHVDVPIQTFDKTYTQTQIDHMVSFSKMVWMFGITKRNLQMNASELKAAIARKREKLCAEYLDNGFESTSYSHTGYATTTTITTAGGDGEGPFDDDHSREDGGTDMNNILYDGTTYNLPAGYAALKAYDRTMSLFKDPRGNPRPASLTHIVVKKGGSAAQTFKEILGAVKRGRIPESFDSDAPAVGSFELIELDYLANSAYHFGFDASRALTDREGFQFIEAQAPTLKEQHIVLKTSEIQYKIESVSTHGHNDVARCWVGSKGTSAAPST